MLQSIYTGLSSLTQHQKAMDATAHNIVNANTPGYTKQRVNFSPNPSKDLGTIHIGSGVNTQSITRIHDEMLFSQLKRSLENNNEHNEAYGQLSKLKDILISEDLSGPNLSNLLNDFFDSLEALSTDPSNESLRQTSKIKGEDFLNRGVMLNDTFNEFKKDIGDQKKLLLDEANSYLSQLDALTKEINIIEAGNELNTATKDYANDIRDRRDLLESKLSQIGNFKAYKDGGTTTGDVNIHEFGREYTYSFDEGGGRIAGMNAALRVIDKTQKAFAESFGPVSTEIESFVSDTAKDPNSTLEWRYANNPVEKINNAYIGLSSSVDSAGSMSTSTKAILDGYQNRQDSLSKVNLDDEMTNMIRYQRAYEAAAKVIQTSDEMLQTLLDMKR